MVKALLFLAGEKGYTALSELLKSNTEDVCCSVVSFRETNVTESYYEKIVRLCREHRIEYMDWNEIRPVLEDYLKDNRFSFAAAIAWKYLLPLSLNGYLDRGLIVFHDSLLPKYRGFAPTPTAMIKGEKNTGVTVLFASDEADNGDIIFQESMPVGEDDYIADVIKRQSELYAVLLKKVFLYVREGRELPRTKQKDAEATYSIWRNPEDCAIDWNRSAQDIYNLVRAVGKPYPGAYAYYEDRKVFVDRVRICEDRTFEIREPGKIWKITENCPEVICGSGMLKIEKARDESGQVFEFKKLRVRLK